jgi:hypothetical protein
MPSPPVQAASMRGGYTPAPYTPQATASESYPNGPGTVLSPAGYTANGSAVAAGPSLAAFSQDGANNDGLSISPAREAPPSHQFQRQNGLRPDSLTDGAPAAAAPVPASLNRTNSARDVVAGTTEANIVSPYRQSPHAAAFVTPVAEEKESGSVRSSSKRHAVLTTPTQQAQAASAANAANTTTAGRSAASSSKDKPTASPSATSKGSPSPYASSYNLSPNLSGLVKTGERRNGVPVTTVNLSTTGLKRGPSFRDAMPAQRSPNNK